MLIMMVVYHETTFVFLTIASLFFEYVKVDRIIVAPLYVSVLFETSLCALVSKSPYVVVSMLFFEQVLLTDFTGSRTASLQTAALLHVLFVALHFVINYSLA